MGRRGKYMCSTKRNYKPRIKSRTVTLGGILSGGEYVIPIYQRPYEWEEAQIDKVFEQICNICDYEENTEKEEVFFGSLQFNINDNKEIEIIDGQQRITTFLLIIQALIHGKKGLEFDDEKKKIIIGKCSIKYKNNIKKEKFYNNFKYILSCVEKQAINIEDMYNYIIFVEIYTEMEKSLEKMLKIFSTMNMEGLPLQTEDIFKLKYSDLFRSESAEVLGKINQKYEEIYNYNNESKTCELSEYDIIDTFKFYIISSFGKEFQTAKYMRQNAITFFVENIDKIRSKSDKIRIEVFSDIADTIIETQKIIDKKNTENIKEDNLKWFARELISESKYWNLRNIVFYIVYRISENKGATEEEDVEKALKLSEIIWQYCSIYRAAYSKIVNEVYDKIIESFIKPENVEDIKNIESLEVENNEVLKAFKDMLEGDCLSGHLPHLMVELSYFHDCIGKSVGEVKKYIFYREYNKDEVGIGKQTHLDIEHIISQHFEGEPELDAKLINSIGNLMYLERNINRNIGKRLGNRLKDNKDYSFEEDISEIKIPDKEGSNLISYKNSKLQCVKNIVEEYNENRREWGIKQCENRSKEKIQFIKKIYYVDFKYEYSKVDKTESKTVTSNT